jgi:hypothetical protein
LREGVPAVFAESSVLAMRVPPVDLPKVFPIPYPAIFRSPSDYDH